MADPIFKADDPAQSQPPGLSDQGGEVPRIGRVAAEIHRRLTDGLSPEVLNIVDDSARHHGHAGADERGESHFNVLVVTTSFEGQTAVQRQRQVYGLLGDLMKDRIHALSLVTRTPSEHLAAQSGG